MCRQVKKLTNWSATFVLVLPFAKDVRSHANHRAPALQGDGVVVAHAPTTFFKGIVVGEVLAFNFVEKAPGGGHLGTNLPFVVNVRGHSHQSADANVA